MSFAPKFVVSIAVPAASLLAGCADEKTLLSSGDDAQSLRAVPSSYTSHRSSVAVTEVISLRIDDGFSLYERAKILRAVNEWNFVLNGYVRFDIVAPEADGKPRTVKSVWLLNALKKSSLAMRGGANLETLAVMLGIPSGGGIMAVILDRLGTRDLTSVMRHELGHVLGLGHDAHGGVMAAVYSPFDQGCIGRRAALAIATNRHLPAEEHNWCNQREDRSRRSADESFIV